MTSGHTAPHITEDMLHAYVDDQLSPKDAARVEDHLAATPDAAELVASWQIQNQQLEALFPRGEAEARVARLDIPQDIPDRHRPMVPLALTAALCLGLGLAGGWIAHDRAAPPAALAPTALQALDLRARQAHLVYAPEVLHPVEVAATDEAHLVAWLSNRLGAPLSAPDLSAVGLVLMGGRLLPSGEDAAAQLMYQDASGERVTVFLTAGAPGVLANFRFSDPAEGTAVASISWEDDRFRYAVVGALPRDDLMAVATELYRQFL